MMWSAPCAALRYGCRRAGEGLFEKGAAKAQTLTVNSMADALRDMPLHRVACLAEGFTRHVYGIDGDHLILVSMHEEDGRAFAGRR